MKTQEQFVETWKIQMIGIIMFGTYSNATEGNFAKAGRLLNVPAEAIAMLKQMYDSFEAPGPRTLESCADELSAMMDKATPEMQSKIIARLTLKHKLKGS